MKRIILVSIVVIMPLIVEGQDAGFLSRLVPSVQVVEQCLEQTMVVVRRDYQLVDTTTGITYGWGDCAEFSCGYSLGFFSDRGLIVSDDFLKPWENDTNYEMYKDEPYRPLATGASIHLLRSSISEEVRAGTTTLTKITDDFYSLQSTNPGLKIDNEEGHKSGLLVLLMGRGTLDSMPVKDVSLTINKRDIEVTSYEPYHNIEIAATSKRVLGGLFVVPQISAGRITFCLVGMLQNQEGQWKLVTPFAVEDDENSLLNAPQEPVFPKKSTRKGKLMPVKKTK